MPQLQESAVPPRATPRDMTSPDADRAYSEHRITAIHDPPRAESA
jgi:hypothetical protein